MYPDCTVLIAAFSDSLYNVLQKPMLRRYTSVEYATYTLTAGALSLCPYMPELLDQFGEAPAAAVGGVLYLGTFGTAVTYALWSYSISRCGVCHIIVFQYAIPILGTMIGYVVLGETSPEMALWGGALALLGAVISWLPPRFRPKFRLRGEPGSLVLGGKKRKAVSPAAVRSPVRRDGDNSGP